VTHIGRKWLVWNAAGCRFQPHLLDAQFAPLGYDQLDVSRGEVHVKVFGSAEVVGIAAAAKPAIGKLDSEAAIEVLEAEGFKIIASSLGGSLGRQLQFHTGTGEVALRGLGKTRAEDVVDE
jgi:chemotaxis receptor (MCP) glutamine deamidase CheD